MELDTCNRITAKQLAEMVLANSIIEEIKEGTYKSK